MKKVLLLCMLVMSFSLSSAFSFVEDRSDQVEIVEDLSLDVVTLDNVSINSESNSEIVTVGDNCFVECMDDYSYTAVSSGLLVSNAEVYPANIRKVLSENRINDLSYSYATKRQRYLARKLYRSSAGGKSRRC